MNEQRTPGSWQVRNWYSDAGKSCGISNGILGVASVYGMGRAETEANARLVAAAPDMLEALAKIVRYADSEPDVGHRVEMHRANIERARAAIARALPQPSAGN